MPTIPPEEGPPSRLVGPSRPPEHAQPDAQPDEHPDEQPHEARRMAESFGSDAARYDRARPRYPDAMVERIAAAAPGPDVLDVGCGTGIAARQFQAAGCRVLGVDVDARMARFARGKGLEVEVATFETWDPAGRTFDALVAAQTWHWVDPAAGAAKAAAVLRPDGRLALFWNVHLPSPEVAAAFDAVHRRVLPGARSRMQWTQQPMDAFGQLFDKAADTLRQAGEFSAAEQWRTDWERSYTRDEWLEQIPTSGEFGQYPPDQAARLLTETGAAIDAMGGSFTMRYATVAITAARTDAGRPRGA